MAYLEIIEQIALWSEIPQYIVEMIISLIVCGTIILISRPVQSIVIKILNSNNTDSVLADPPFPIWCFFMLCFVAIVLNVVNLIITAIGVFVFTVSLNGLAVIFPGVLITIAIVVKLRHLMGVDKMVDKIKS